MLRGVGVAFVSPKEGYFGRTHGFGNPSDILSPEYESNRDHKYF